MHFSKTYAQLLLSLPPEISENAIQYRKLKKLINDVVRELTSLGLSPDVLQEMLESNTSHAALKEHEDTATEPGKPRHPRAVYEVTDGLGHIEPHLRLYVDTPTSSSTPTTGISSSSLRSEEEKSEATTDLDIEEEHQDMPDVLDRPMSLLWRLQSQAYEQDHSIAEIGDSLDDLSLSDTHFTDSSSSSSGHSIISPALQLERDAVNPGANASEVVISLASDMAFFQALANAISGLSVHMLTMQSDFVETLNKLSRTIARSARPASSVSGFQPHSGISSKPWSVSSTAKVKSDLYAWREIFQLYVEAEVFESVHELDRGERSVDESETRLKHFADRVTVRGLGDGRKLTKSSREALETFLELNIFILNIKKASFFPHSVPIRSPSKAAPQFQFANAEATRKILKKHTKRTSLPSHLDDPSLAVVLPKKSTTLPRVLVQAIGEILIPIIPHIDDYSCLICTSIAFKPIRLSCGHLFCVRCLVKMQKRGNGNCPMCRAPTVLRADRTNVDWALLNFMQDWFPVEAQEKLLQNQKEATREEFEEAGLDPDQSCRVM
ncbi:hypothetical protein H0H93_016228 [Arthromyces matolae]|nr:hypothetical protein H0H93_016228 [Arthromyces matolae]